MPTGIYPRTTKHRENTSKQMKKFWSAFDSKERDKKISDSRKGHTVSTQTRKKISEANLGRGAWNKGKKHSEKTIKKIKLHHRGMSGRKHSIETRKNMSMAWLGRQDYTGGSTKILREIRLSLKYKLWREKVFKRDNYVCQICGGKKNLQGDHIKSFTYYPELRFKVSNGRVLCKQCHKKTDNYGQKAKKYQLT